MSILGTICLLLEFMKFTMSSSICCIIFLLGEGSITAMCVNLDRREVLAMFTLPKIVVENFCPGKTFFSGVTQGIKPVLV